jgi:putative transposase
MERTLRTLKYEHIFLLVYSTISKLRLGLDQFINYFNTTIPHQSLGYYVPKDVYYNTFVDVATKEEKHVNYSWNILSSV